MSPTMDSPQLVFNSMKAYDPPKVLSSLSVCPVMHDSDPYVIPIPG